MGLIYPHTNFGGKRSTFKIFDFWQKWFLAKFYFCRYNIFFSFGISSIFLHTTASSPDIIILGCFLPPIFISEKSMFRRSANFQPIIYRIFSIGFFLNKFHRNRCLAIIVKTHEFSVPFHFAPKTKCKNGELRI